jgi:hypothetical protein
VALTWPFNKREYWEVMEDLKTMITKEIRNKELISMKKNAIKMQNIYYTIHTYSILGTSVDTVIAMRMIL